MRDFQTTFKTYFPGVLLSGIVAVAATFLSEHYGGPAMLFAILLGMALGFLAEEGQCVAGINLSSSSVLRIGVALLGLRITLMQIESLGAPSAAMVVGSVLLTIVGGAIVASRIGLGRSFGVLTGGAVAICGASAALAISAVLPRNEETDRNTSFAVIGVTALSALAMIVYPAVAALLGFNDRDAGIFLGGTIHDVAQVVGAGYARSVDTGDTATIVKLMRVAMLVPTVVVISFMSRRHHAEGARRPPPVPWFIIAFAVLMLINSTGWVPLQIQNLASAISRWCLVIAISAIGMKTSLKALYKMGHKPVLALVVETLVLAVLVCASILWLRQPL